MSQARPTPIYLEIGSKKAFACSLEWPGWCRSGRDADAAIEALAGYADRYRPVAERAGVRFPANAAGAFDVVERINGDVTTDFGAPGKVAKADREALTKAQAERLASLVAASWSVLDAVAAHAPAKLAKGPRGGGRDRDAVVIHVADADLSYARKLGIREPADRRAAILDALRAARAGAPPVEKGWPPRYAARRIAWHALDHAWEIEDKS